MRGFRNIPDHQYIGFDIDAVRDVVETHLPPLAEALRNHIERDSVLTGFMTGPGTGEALPNAGG
ncbi:MAG: HepT-like ribonuclease domain-containing protein [Gulosibacter sp.]|uniref:HepT-like ribonuclease domain-containing protein n=1 Tax=Gulosibacter sp. TaxID=2817531 RepID=UPI003F917F87